jgi:hypothetical protein
MLVIGAVAQTANLQFVVDQNAAGVYDVRIQLQANGSSFKLGSSNLVFTYNTSALSNPTLLTAQNFSGGNYDVITVTPGPPVSVNVVLNVVNNGTAVAQSPAWTDVATVRFTTVQVSGNSGLQWQRGFITIYKDTEAPADTVGKSSLINLDTSPLPIQLATFTAAPAANNGVLIQWKTLSETNSYGFWVQRSSSATGTFVNVNSSIIAGSGTSTESHLYSYTDPNPGPGVWYYRLQQVDLSGAVYNSDAIKMTTTAVTERPLPKQFALDQNYPNPFNPTTTIEFALPKETHVKIDVYNIIGEKVATLVDETRSAGYYKEQFNAVKFSSGIYFYKMTTNETSFLKKMMLVK